MHAEPELMDVIDPAVALDLQAALEQDYVDGELANRLLDAVAELGLQSWVARYHSQIGVGSHGPLGFAALSAPDLHTALLTMEEFLEVRNSGTRLTVTQDNSHICLIFTDLSEYEPSGRWLMEASTLVTQEIIEHIIVHPLGPQAYLHFAYPRGESAEDLEAVFNAPCHYMQKDNRLCIPKSWANLPSPLADDDTFRSNIAKLRQLKAKQRADQSDALNLVQSRLLEHFDRRIENTARRLTIPTLDVIADELGMSSRTLIRKLDKQGETYKSLLQKTRLQRAQHLLKNTHLNAAEIADKLGYQEAANFSRAFKQWTGVSPGAWRRGN